MKIIAHPEFVQNPAVFRKILPRTGILLALFVVANLVAAHFMSDCGLPAVLGLDACADDIARAGLPFLFFEDGGLAFHSFFSLSAFAGDVLVGIVGSCFLAAIVTLGPHGLGIPKPR